MVSIRLYHATPATNLESVLENGLDPEASRSSQRGVYLAVSPGDTLNYVAMKADEHDEFVVLEIALDPADVERLGPDDYELRGLLDDMSAAERRRVGVEADVEWHDLDWRRSLELCGQVVHLGKLDPSKTTVFGTVNANVSPLEIVRVEASITLDRASVVTPSPR